MASEWEGGTVNSSKIPKQLFTGRKDVIQMLHKMNSTTSYSDIQQSKIGVSVIW